MHLVFTSPRKHSLPQWTFFIPERSRCDNLKHHQSQSHDRRTPSLMILKFSWSKKERKIAFLSAALFSTLRLCKIPSYSLKGGHSLESTSLTWSPLPGKAIKATLFYFTQNYVAAYYSARVNRGRVSATSSELEKPALIWFASRSFVWLFQMS